ncbi:MAG: pseudouridine synthase [Clostridia bacterium]|nr:pseudouridine synthase [Lachnospiraceae bacterium]NCC00595.1 pseudouridine synthase [Clostridia bacterium]NCD02023.1 pseudouridine synthase [Clostridia bacterium]
MEKIRLNKYLSAQGVCSRREADRYVKAGKVTINGRIAEMGEKVDGTESIVIDGRTVGAGPKKKVVLAMNKPKGIVCSSKEKDNIIDYMKYPERIYPVGRLDKNSTGLILLSNDGELMNEILKARNYHEKEYEVRVNQRISTEFIRHMSKGVYLEELDATTRPCKVKKVDAYTFRIILTQGLNRQIRRMCAYFNYRVVTLKRVRIMNILLGDLPEGKCRELTLKEMKELEGALKHE